MKSFDWEANKSLVTDSTGRRLTIGLFKELSDNPSAPFSIADWRRIYVEIADPTDYKAAHVLIGQWEHWTMLTECKAFATELAKWRAEVEVKLRSEAIAELRKQAKTEKGTAAAKYLAGEAAPRGRPPKKKEDDAAPETKRVADDARRLKLV